MEKIMDVTGFLVQCLVIVASSGQPKLMTLSGYNLIEKEELWLVQFDGRVIAGPSAMWIYKQRCKYVEEKIK